MPTYTTAPNPVNTRQSSRLRELRARLTAAEREAIAAQAALSEGQIRRLHGLDALRRALPEIAATAPTLAAGRRIIGEVALDGEAVGVITWAPPLVRYRDDLGPWIDTVAQVAARVAAGGGTS